MKQHVWLACQYLRARRRVALYFLLCTGIFCIVFTLFRLPVAAAVYGSLICALPLGYAAVRDWLHWRQKYFILQNLRQEILNTTDNLPVPGDVVEQAYQGLIQNLSRSKAAAAAESVNRFQDMTDYYTLWAHQIKTPIAAIRLVLQSETVPEPSLLQQELFQIEQYVDMVLCYLRLDSDSKDFLIRSYELDGIVRQALRKFAPWFIRKRLQLHYHPVSCAVLTDEKWLLFALEQVISNAIKYTSRGGVTISLEEPATLVIRDTGLGIAPEDLPRIFERGYTGRMGRLDKRATGIGLYLCRRILTQLGHSITAESVLRQGTTIRLCLESVKLNVE